MTVDEVMNEFRSAFHGKCQKFPIWWGGGARGSLTWSAQQVAKLGSNRGTIYILTYLPWISLRYITNVVFQCVYTIITF